MNGAVGNGEWGPFQLNDLLDAGRSQPPFQSIKIRLATDKSLPKSSLGRVVWVFGVNLPVCMQQPLINLSWDGEDFFLVPEKLVSR